MDNAYKPSESSLRASDIKNPKEEKMYKVSGIVLATFLGSLLAGGWLLSRNFKVMGDEARARTTLIVCCIGTAVVLALGLLLPESWNVPNAVFVVPQIIAVLQYAKQTQAAAVDAHAAEGGQLASNWRAAGVAVIAMLVLFAVLIPVVFMIQP